MQPFTRYRPTANGGHLGPHPDRFAEVFRGSRAYPTTLATFARTWPDFSTIRGEFRRIDGKF